MIQWPRLLCFVGFAVLTSLAPAARSVAELTTAPTPMDMVRIPGGTFAMGSFQGDRDETPVHPVRLAPFWIDQHEVTVAQFRGFIRATGHRTAAERDGHTKVFAPVTTWTLVRGATWHHPDGPDQPAAADQEPVCQISWEDAAAYAAWAGKRLPTEAEWECAARGGLRDQPLPWGQELTSAGKHLANTWQGEFPKLNVAADGFSVRAPVMSFPPNAFGLYDTSGNVWEWVADYYAEDYYARSEAENPHGPERPSAFDVDGTPKRVVRGGSYLCSASWCSGYRVSARSAHNARTGLSNIGFRCAKSE